MGLEIGRIAHDRLALWSLKHCQTFHHPQEDALVAPAFSAIIKCHGGTLFLRRIAPSEPIAIDENDVAQNTPIINTGAAMAIGEYG